MSHSLIEYQFGQVGTSNDTYNYYDSQMLNQSFTIVNDSINFGNPVAPGYLLATLQAFNATPSSQPGGGSGNNGASTSSNGDSGNTGLAMSACLEILFILLLIQVSLT